MHVQNHALYENSHRVPDFDSKLRLKANKNIGMFGTSKNGECMPDECQT